MFRGNETPAVATLLEGADRAEAWERLIAAWPSYSQYQELSGRGSASFGSRGPSAPKATRPAPRRIAMAAVQVHGEKHAPRKTGTLLAGLLALLVVGCGGDPDRATSPTDAATTAAPPNLEQYLLQADEVPGLTPVSTPQTDTGEPFDLPEDGAELLLRSGYISTTYQAAEGDLSGGVSSVLLFETEAGAREWMTYETSDEAIRHQIPGAKIKRFQVPSVPGANGWTGPDLHGYAIGHVYWTQGRCMLLIGLEVEGPRVEPLSIGAKAIYDRTGGTCPV